ncbi:hypothetical protein KUTeg_002474 [Tegillarca granosa]|uniref:Uncharacterized protein n=1 Tax=Tegillarca granosa TaxID=220873 RepID=A0ABQ9FUE3_TEGGR|nr:hypothetical protein KUTeg_002474 [Tegillarca granosa]
MLQLNYMYTNCIKMYETKILPESFYKPYFIYTYSDMCYECAYIEHIIERFIKELEGVGKFIYLPGFVLFLLLLLPLVLLFFLFLFFCCCCSCSYYHYYHHHHHHHHHHHYNIIIRLGIGSFHAGISRSLSNQMKITRVPTLMAVVNGRISYFRSGVSLSNLRDYIRNLFPSNTAIKLWMLKAVLSDANYQDFLSGWHDNHVRAIFFGQKSDPSVRLLAPAFQYKEYVKFGYVDTRSASNLNIMHRYNVNRNRESFMMFNEETNTSVATISMQQLPRTTLDEVIQSNKFLLLPRLSSQKHFEELCPAELKAKRKRLCIILVTKKSEEHDEYRELFRKYVQKSELSQNERVNFVYIYEETQQLFIQTLAKGGNFQLQNNILKVAIIWRKERNHLSYEWLKDGWFMEKKQMKDSEKHLENRVKELLNSDKSLVYDAVLPEFHNEHKLNLMIRICYRLLEWGENLYNFVFRFENTTLLAVILSCVFMFGMTYFMSKITLDNRIVHVYEMRYETYNTLVAEADTGLTITLLVDNTVKETLVQKFGELMFPYSSRTLNPYLFPNYNKNKFKFDINELFKQKKQMLEYIGWYRHLLEESVENRKHLPNINIHNCTGTVLAINGYRKYYYIYHAKKVRKWMRNSNKVTHAIGFVETDEESSEEEDLTKGVSTEKLLDGLLAWLDRVFDGSLKKIRVPFWPEMTLK